MAANAGTSVTEFRVVKTTTDKLEDALNGLVDEGYLELKHEWVGGRDWVIVARLGEE